MKAITLIICSIIIGAAMVLSAQIKASAYYEAVTYECYGEDEYEEEASPTEAGRAI